MQVAGGIKSDFVVEGDFVVTVDYALHDFPLASAPFLALNLIVLATSPGPTVGYANMFGVGPISVMTSRVGVAKTRFGAQPSSGTLRLERSGTTFTGSILHHCRVVYSETVEGVDGPLPIWVLADQLSVASVNRAATSLHVAFKNLKLSGPRDPVRRVG